ncbi:MAG: endonuclease domain-containing protein [Hyphococcus sp.]
MPIRKPHPNAKSLRKDMPSAERKLWARIRNKQLGGFRFRRQHTVGPYIADFACVETRIIIELDGDQHGADDGARDAKRDAFIESKGWQVLRFWNNDVYGNIDGVLDVILDACENARRENNLALPD